MLNRREIRDSKGNLLAYKIGKDLPHGLQPYSDEDDYVQVLSWKYQDGKKLASHIHREAHRVAGRTQEVVVVLTGKLRADVFDQELQLARSILLGAGESMVFLSGGHGYEILEDDTRVLEIKNGPYPGAAADRERF